MMQSIGSALPASANGQPGNSGILQVQLDRTQTQLADWCHCPSGKTADGKKKIAELQDKADSLKVQLAKIETARAQQKESRSATAPAATSPPAAITTVGNLLDVTA